jgi:signal transduction histidine kinase
MEGDTTPQRPKDASGALGVVLIAAAGLFVLTRLLTAAQGGVARVGDAGRDAADVGVLIAVAVCLFALWARTRGLASARLARELPIIVACVPAPVTLVALLTTELVPAAPLPLAASAASGWLTAAAIAPGLRTLVMRGVLDEPVAAPAPPLWRALVWPTIAAAASALAIVLAELVVLADRMALPERGWLAIGLLGGLAAFSVAAVRAAGLGVGGDARSMVRRLDALGMQERVSEAPIVPTDLDQMGELFGALERLRSRLDHEQRLYQEALERTQAADAAKQQFLTAVSHELRTPLHTVGGYTQALLAGIASPLSDAQAEDVRLIQAGGRQLLALVTDILDVSMIESGELRLSFAPTDLGALVDEVVRIHQPLVRDANVSLGVELVEIPDVVCDRRRIAQILTNLLSNAIKFTERGAIVVRCVGRGDRAVEVSVTDTGVGIAPDELPLIFDEYQQAGTISRRKKGTGLGLAIARSIALAHGGSLGVVSALGLGSTFTLVLPIDPPQRPAAIDIAEEAARALMRARGRSEHVEEERR